MRALAHFSPSCRRCLCVPEFANVLENRGGVENWSAPSSHLALTILFSFRPSTNATSTETIFSFLSFFVFFFLFLSVFWVFAVLALTLIIRFIWFSCVCAVIVVVDDVCKNDVHQILIQATRTTAAKENPYNMVFECEFDFVAAMRRNVSERERER